MRGLFYDPRVHDNAGAFGRGLMNGVNAGLSILQFNKRMDLADTELKSKQIDLERKKNIQGAEEEIRALKKSLGMTVPTTESGTTEMTGPAPGPNDKGLSELLGYTHHQATANEQESSLAKRAMAAQKQGQPNEHELNARLTKGIYDIYMRRGLVDFAQGMVKIEYAIAESIAKSVGPEAALEFLKKGSQAEIWKDAVAVNKGDHWEVKNFGPDSTGILKIHKKTGEVVIVREPTEKAKEAPKTRTIIQGDQRVDQEWDATAQLWREVGRGERYKDNEGKGGDKTALQKDVAWLVEEFGMTKKQALRLKKTMSGKSRESFILDAYNSALRDNFGDASAAEASMKKAGEIYDRVMGEGAQKPAAPVGGNRPKGVPSNARKAEDGNWYVPDPRSKSGWAILKRRRNIIGGDF
jgi:hypothetical protein